MERRKKTLKDKGPEGRTKKDKGPEKKKLKDKGSEGKKLKDKKPSKIKSARDDLLKGYA